MIESSTEATMDDVAELAMLAGAARAEKADVRGGRTFLDREAPPEPDADRFAAAVSSQDHAVLVGQIDGITVGYATMRFEQMHSQGSLGVVDELFVLEQARGVGVGEALMNRLVEVATAAGCVGIDSIALPGDRHTKNFFETFGLKARALTVHRSLRQRD